MKHLLPILTLALLGAAATVSAENFYYDYYQNPDYSSLDRKNHETESWAYYYTDSFSYVDSENNKGFSVARNSNWNAQLNQSNFYRIHVVGDDVNLSLTDYVDNVGGSLNGSALHNNLSEYGYRKLTLNEDGKYVVAGDTTVFKLTGEDAVTPSTIDSVYFEKSYLDENNNPVDDSYTVTRYQYNLGTFKNGDVIELYMKDLDGGEAYSYSGFNEAPTSVGAEGGFGDGGYRVNAHTDELLNGYYYQDENLENKGYHGFGENDAAREAASAKSMPLSALDPSGTRLYFGIIASAAGIIDDNNGGESGGNGASGRPLPGGLSIALIAGLFGLGFWYIRRRKATVA